MNNGKLTDKAVAAALAAAQNQDVMNAIQLKQTQAVGEVIVVLLSHFAQDPNVGINCLINILGATAANNNVEPRQLFAGLEKAYEHQRDLRKRKAASESASPRLIAADGKPFDQPAGTAPETDPQVPAFADQIPDAS